MIPRIRITDRQFDLLASGGGDPGTIRTLLAGRLSKNILLIRAVMAQARTSPSSPALEDAYSLLTRAQQRAPEAVTAVLSSPSVSLWSVSRLRSAEKDPALPRALAEDGYLSCVAASAALQAGEPFEIELPVLGRHIPLPGLGTVIPGQVRGRATGEPATGTAWLRSDGKIAILASDRGRVQIPLPPSDSGAEPPGWRPALFLRADADGVAITVQLDDRDPYRAPRQLLARQPEGSAQLSRWQALFEQAWGELVQRHRPQAVAMAASGLRVLVPLVSRGNWTESNSATVLDAFGTVLLCLPPDPSSLALTLLHEFQHGKLAALQDTISLHQDDSRRRYYAPWRDDPRPLGALLQGTYAHVAVAEFWRTRWRDESRTGNAPVLLQARYLSCEDDICDAVSQLRSSGQLTGAGERFVDGIAAAASASPAPKPSIRALRLRGDLRASNRIGWRIAHLRPDPAAVSLLARSWLAGGSPVNAPLSITVTLVPGARGPCGSVRQHLAARAVLPAADRRDCTRSASPAGGHADVTPSTADLEYANGRYRAAREGYLAELAACPQALSAWTGLALCALRLARSSGEHAAADLLCQHPELVRALYLRVREIEGSDPDPVALTAWVSDWRHRMRYFYDPASSDK